MNIAEQGRKLFKLLRNILKQAVVWIKAYGMLLIYYRPIRRLCKLSMLTQTDRYALKKCPVCGSQAMKVFFSFPFGWPEGQVHSILYFDYDEVDVSEILRYRVQLDKLMGFFVSVPWNFCTNCKNASLNLVFNEEHLATYYSSYYKRSKPLHVNRRQTKVLHGEFLKSFLPEGARVLEIGAAEGYVSEFLAKAGFKVWANELSADHNTKLKEIRDVTVVNDLFSLPQEGVNCIFMHHVLEHVPDPVKFINELKRPLVEGGLLFIQVPDVSTQIGLYTKYLRYSPFNVMNPYNLNLGDTSYAFIPAGEVFSWIEALLNDHLLAFTPDGLRWLLEACGFRVEKIIQSKSRDVTIDNSKYSWPVDIKTGNTPNSITVLARKVEKGKR